METAAKKTSHAHTKRKRNTEAMAATAAAKTDSGKLRSLQFEGAGAFTVENFKVTSKYPYKVTKADDGILFTGTPSTVAGCSGGGISVSTVDGRTVTYFGNMTGNMTVCGGMCTIGGRTIAGPCIIETGSDGRQVVHDLRAEARAKDGPAAPPPEPYDLGKDCPRVWLITCAGAVKVGVDCEALLAPDELVLELSGSSDLHIRGRVPLSRRLTVAASGVAHAKVANLVDVPRVNVHASGSADVTLALRGKPSAEIDCAANGAANIKVTGIATSLRLDTSGTSSIGKPHGLKSVRAVATGCSKISASVEDGTSVDKRCSTCAGVTIKKRDKKDT